MCLNTMTPVYFLFADDGDTDARRLVICHSLFQRIYGLILTLSVRDSRH